ncbi:MAG: SDR family oxidoreductase [Bdellovibrionales bacterium]|nr:SDR family oxidoreductase [Bdellovibrionales bacterium]
MKTVIISGSNRGIGLELCRTFYKNGYRVMATCRKSNPSLDELGVDVIEGIDISKPETYLSWIQTLDSSIDCVVNNAGIWRTESLQNFNTDTIMEQYLVNAVGPLAWTMALLPKLRPSAKIAFITSRMGSITDNSSGGRYGYRMSKCALNAGAKSLALDLQSQGIAVGLLHPGFVRTDMTEGQGDWEAEESSRALFQRIEELTIESTGIFRHANGELLPW